VHVYTHACTVILIFTQIHTHTHTHTYIHRERRQRQVHSADAAKRTLIHTYIYTETHTHTDTYIHTHIHTYTERDAKDGFTALMLQSVPFTSKFDEYVLVKLSHEQNGAGSREGGGNWDQASMYGKVREPGVHGV
jgi:hypothetical protein